MTPQPLSPTSNYALTNTTDTHSPSNTKNTNTLTTTNITRPRSQTLPTNPTLASQQNTQDNPNSTTDTRPIEYLTNSPTLTKDNPQHKPSQTPSGMDTNPNSKQFKTQSLNPPLNMVTNPQQIKTPHHPPPHHLRKIFIGSLSPHTTEQTLHNYFSKFGEIVEVAIKYDKLTRRSKQYAFIEFTSPDMAERVQQTNYTTLHSIDGRNIDIKKVSPNARFSHGSSRDFCNIKWKKLLYTQGCPIYDHAGASSGNQIFSFSSCRPPHNNVESLDTHTLLLDNERNISGPWRFLSKTLPDSANTPPPLQNHSAFPLDNEIFTWGGHHKGEYSNKL